MQFNLQFYLNISLFFDTINLKFRLSRWSSLPHNLNPAFDYDIKYIKTDLQYYKKEDVLDMCDNSDLQKKKQKTPPQRIMIWILICIPEKYFHKLFFQSNITQKLRIAPTQIKIYSKYICA